MEIPLGHENKPETEQLDHFDPAWIKQPCVDFSLITNKQYRDSEISDFEFGLLKETIEDLSRQLHHCQGLHNSVAGRDHVPPLRLR